jgi:hypothetical protein
MRRLWVFLLGTIAFSAGAFVGIAYSGGTGSFASFRVACELLNSAEGAGMLDRAQRVDVVDRVVWEMRKSVSGVDPRGIEVVGQLKTGCPSLPSW